MALLAPIQAICRVKSNRLLDRLMLQRISPEQKPRSTESRDAKHRDRTNVRSNLTNHSQTASPKVQ